MEKVTLITTVGFLSHKEGGRRNPAFVGYRPNLVFCKLTAKEIDEAISNEEGRARISIPESAMLFNVDAELTALVNLRPYKTDGKRSTFYARLSPDRWDMLQGQHTGFIVREANHVVGYGTCHGLMP